MGRPLFSRAVRQVPSGTRATRMSLALTAAALVGLAGCPQDSPPPAGTETQLTSPAVAPTIEYTGPAPYVTTRWTTGSRPTDVEPPLIGPTPPPAAPTEPGTGGGSSVEPTSPPSATIPTPADAVVEPGATGDG